MSAEFDKMLADDTEYRRLPQGELPAGEVDGEKESVTDVADTTDTSNPSFRGNIFSIFSKRVSSDIL